MTGGVLTVNTGSSSVRVDLFEAHGHQPVRVGSGRVDGIGSSRCAMSWRHGTFEVVRPLGSDVEHDEATAALLHHAARGPEIGVVGHRIVHGGPDHLRPEVSSPAVLATLGALVSLAPLHLPANLAGVRLAAELMPGVSQVLCYDTAFHATLPPEASRLALPAELRDRGLHRYGFHGLSYEHVAGELRHLLGRSARRVVVAHLGSGASLCALLDGRSVATTMGLTPLDGLPMGTRCGSLDPGVVLHLLRTGWNVDDLEDLLYRRSGLLGLSGTSADLRDLLPATEGAAADAVDLFTYRVREAIGALAADLGGLDALVFTGGIGEHLPEVRARICAGLGWLGVVVDPAANDAGLTWIDALGSRSRVLVVPTDEAVTIARHALAVLHSSHRWYLHAEASRA